MPRKCTAPQMLYVCQWPLEGQECAHVHCTCLVMQQCLHTHTPPTYWFCSSNSSAWVYNIKSRHNTYLHDCFTNIYFHSYNTHTHTHSSVQECVLTVIHVWSQCSTTQHTLWTHAHQTFPVGTCRPSVGTHFPLRAFPCFPCLPAHCK